MSSSEDSEFGTFSLETVEVHIDVESNKDEEKIKLLDNDFTSNNVTVASEAACESIKKNCSNRFFWWIKLWNPSLSFKQLSIRDRESNFYAFDAMRAFAYFWVQLDHIAEGLKILYPKFSAAGQYAVFQNGTNSPTVFFAISGFLNFYVLTRISEKYGETTVSFKSIRNYIFRRYMHLAPNLYIMVALVTILGYYSNSSYLKSQFYTTCSSYWWTDVLFIVGDINQISTNGNCYNSTWSISVEFQFYLMSLPLVKIYGYSKILSILLIGLGTWYSFHLRMYGALSGKLGHNYNLKSPFRFDAYGLGMLLYVAWDNILKPLKTRSYSKVSYEQLKTPIYSSYPKLIDLIENPYTAIQFISTYTYNSYLTIEHYLRVYVHDWKYYMLNYPNSGKFLLLILWILCVFASYVGLYDAFVNVPSWPWLDPTLSIGKNYNSSYVKCWSLMTYALATVTIIALSIEGTIFPLSWFMNMFIWYPLGNITYTSYLLSIPSIYWIFTYLLDLNGGVTLPGHVSYNLFYKYYWSITLINLLLGVTLSFISERPFMNLSKAIEL